MCQLLGMNCNSPTDISFSFEGFRRRAGITDKHSDGFGIGFFEGKGVRIFRDNQAAAFSPVGDAIKNYQLKSFNVIAHIRQATVGEINIENTHPFIREIWGENWMFAHNGTIDEFVICPNNHYQPIGTTDSERVFCAIATKLKKRFSKKPSSEKEIFDAIVEIGEAIAKNGVLNFILSNGEWMIARCATKLHYVTRKYPFTKVLREDDAVIDVSQYCTEKDKVTIITTQPFTKNEDWTEMKNGGYVLFKDGEKVFEIIGTLPPCKSHV